MLNSDRPARGWWARSFPLGAERAVNVLRNWLSWPVDATRAPTLTPAPAGHCSIIGFIDRPRDWFIVGAPLSVRGWAIGVDPIQTISVYWDDRCLGYAELGQPRPDVVRALPNYPAAEAGRSGFKFEAERAPETDVDAALRIIAVDGAGESTALTASLTPIASQAAAINFLKERATNESKEYAAMARSFSMAGCYDDAEGVLTEAVERFPDAANALIGLASLAAQRGKWDLALQRWEDVRWLFPGRAAGFLGAYAALLNLRRSDEAERVLAEALRLFPADPEVAIKYAAQAARRRDWATALKRWERVQAQFPELARGHVETAVALFHLNRLTEAEQIFAATLVKFPNEPRAAAFFAAVATGRRDWKEALIRWKAARERFSSNPLVIGGEARAKYGMWMDLDPACASDSIATSGGGQVSADSIHEQGQRFADALRNHNSDLMLNFENLGNNCDLGLVQRYFRSEPLGLLRFASIKFDSLINALRVRFDGVGSRESTKLMRDAQTREYWLGDKTHEIRMHTYIYPELIDDDAKFEALFNKHCRRLEYLKNKLIADLESAEKIFVFRSDTIMTIADMKRLHCEIRRYGPNTLLCVYNDDGHPSGTVDVLEADLMLGYLERCNPETTNMPCDSWLQICKSAAEIWRSRSANL
jgi:tetratricopeptide (TPR) repeat protein